MAEDQQPQKLFRLPGTIEEEDYQRELQRSSRPESPLLAQKAIPGMPRNLTLLRVSTNSSSITGIARQDSTRSAHPLSLESTLGYCPNLLELVANRSTLRRKALIIALWDIVIDLFIYLVNRGHNLI